MEAGRTARVEDGYVDDGCYIGYLDGVNEGEA